MSHGFAEIDRLSPEQLEQLIQQLQPSAPKTPGIPRLPRDGSDFALSAAQERLWFLDRLEGSSSAYTIAVAVQLRGALSIVALAASLTRLVARHETLRTVFVEPEDGAPRQRILEVSGVPLPEVDLRALDVGGRRAVARRLALALVRRPFDLDRGPLLRTVLMRLADDRYQLVLDLHHIISDAWSMAVLVSEIGLLYAALLAGRQPALPDLEIQYADYADWERRRAESPELVERLDACCRDLEGAPVVELPGDRPRPAVRSSRGDRTPIALDAPVVGALRRLAEAEGTTLFVVLASLFALFLRHQGAGTDLVIGTPVANRRQREIEGLIGFFVNTLALHLTSSAATTFRSLVGGVAAVSGRALDRQEVAFERLVERLVPRRDLSHPPLVQVMIALDDAARPITLPGIEATLEDLPSGTAKLDLLMQLRPMSDGGLGGWLESSRDLFDPTTARRMGRRLERLSAEAARRPCAALECLSWLSVAERHQLLVAWNDVPPPDARVLATTAGTLDGLFRASVARHGDRPALFFRGELWTYGELAEKSAAVGRRLAELGAGAETLVAIRMERSPALVVALLGVLRSGAAYVPVDPAYPEARQHTLLSDSGARLLLIDADGGSAPAIPAGSAAPETIEMLRLRSDGTLAAPESSRGARQIVPGSEPEGGPRPEGLAYVIYTSGSTGRPKGVAIAHRAAVALVAWSARRYSADELAVVAATTSLCFDLSIFELFATFHRGGMVVLLRDALELAGTEPEKPPVTLLNTVPSAMAELVRQQALPPGVRTVNLAGEPLRGALVDRVYAAGASRVYNLYGPSEDTTYSTWERVPRHAALRGPGSEPTIGRPIDGGRLLVLDATLRQVPAGVPGEVVLGGEGLARCYLRRPAATAERFVPDPWGDGERLYRTGDLGRFLPDGRVEYLGRRDQQVKVRGFRIELGEVEAVLGALGGVAEAAVVAVGDDPAIRRLVAFVVPADPATSPEALETELRARLPGPLVPSELRRVEALPYTPNGKVDRRELARRALDGTDDEPRTTPYAAPRGPLEQLLVGLLEKLLPQPRAVGIDDDFFALGGHSLLAARLASRLSRELDREVPVQWIFEAPTVALLARQLTEGRRRPLPPLVAGPRPVHPPLSPAQERLWFLERLDPGQAVYHLPVVLDLTGAVDAVALEAALRGLVSRHEVLRTRFVEVEPGRPAQAISPVPPCMLAQVDLAGLPAAIRRRQQDRIEKRFARRPFDLAADLPLRALLLRLAEEDHSLLLVAHHIAIDGGSLGVLFDELATIYGGRSRQHDPVKLPPPPIQVADHALWQRGWLQGVALDSLRAAARRHLEGAPEATDLPFDRPPALRPSSRGETLALPLTNGTGRRLETVARRLGATPFMVLMAAFNAALFRWTGQRDLVVGTPVANRERPELDRAIGLYANTLALRTAVDGNLPFAALVRAARAATLESYTLRELPFEELVRELAHRRDLGRAPLFQVFLVLQESLPEPRLPGLDCGLRPLATGAARFDLTLSANLDGDALEAALEVRRERFEPTTRRRLAAQLARLLEAALERPEVTVGRLPLLSTAERHQLLGEWQGGMPEGPATDLWTLFARQAMARPDAEAIVAGDETWTYRCLAERAGRVAAVLAERSVGREEVVAVAAHRSAATVAALLGVMRAGAVYLPLDPAYPVERLAFMLRDSGARLALCDDRLAALCREAGVRALALEPPDGASAGEAAAPETHIPPGQLAYLIYTSGSTGRPKAVAIEHRSAAALVHWSRRAFPDAVIEGVLASTSLCFDLSIFELFVPLARGGSVILARDALELAELAAAPRVTLLNTVPSAVSALQRLGDLPPSVRTVNLAGEPLRRDLVRRVAAAGTVEQVFNLYGPSEDTTYSTVARVPLGEDAEPTVGRPVAGTRGLLLDGALEPVALGVVGELYLAGEGLARGYLGRPARTAERFLPNPWSPAPGGRVYRTGDLARFRRDGELEFLGRMDHQVKIRGFRVELAEIEAALHAHPAVDEAAVLAIPGPDGEPRLVAYVGSASGVSEGSEGLHRHLGRTLPAAMVPSRFVTLAQLPHTPNGKIDRRALPAPSAAPVEDGEEGALRAPQDLVEERLLELFEEALEVSPLGVDHDFFAHGGHSLLAVRLLARLREVFAVELPVRTVFEQSTVARLAVMVRAAVDHTAESAGAVEASPDSGPRRGLAGARPALSWIQERLWFLDHYAESSAAFAMPLALDLVGTLDVRALVRALAAVVGRHGILRSVLRSEGGAPYQQVLPRLELALPLLDLADLSPTHREAAARQAFERTVSVDFDLAQGPLFRVLLVRLDRERHRLVLVAHHAIFDGWSTAVLLRELAAFYRAEAGAETELPESLPFEYADYAVWQRRQEARYAAGLEHYRHQLAGAPRALDLPLDRPRRRGRFRAHRHQQVLGRRFGEALLAFCQRQRATPFMVLNAVLASVLSRWSGQRDVVIGSPVADRDHRALEGLIGPFLNTLVVRLEVTPGMPFEQLVEQAREKALAAHQHRDLPFEKLLAELETERDPERTPVFQVFLNMLSFPRPVLELPGLRVEGVEPPAPLAKFDLTLYARPCPEGRFELDLVSDARIFRPETAGELLRQLVQVLEAGIEEPAREVTRIPLTTLPSRRRLPDPRAPLSSGFCGSLPEIFARQAASTPEAPAVVEDGGETWTYEELHHITERLAAALQERGAGAGARVLIYAHRGASLVAALLGVLRAGAAFTVVDPAYPVGRLLAAFRLVEPRCMLALEAAGEPPAELLRALSADAVPRLELPRRRANLLARFAAVTPAPVTLAADTPAYVALTSGSAGRPKGVLGRHGSLTHFTAGMAERFELAAADRFSLLSALAHDPLHRDVFTPLQIGAAIEVPDPERFAEPGYLASWMVRHGVTVCHGTPAMVRLLTDDAQEIEAPALRRAFLVGEALTRGHVRRLRALAPRVQVVNLYGSTETQRAVSFFSVPADLSDLGAEVLPLGRGMDDVQLLVRSPAGAAGVGELGEIWVRSPHVALGYFGDATLTRDRFRTNPETGDADDRVYRTGDLGRYRADGDVVFAGRGDRQVKIRGFRVELEEIEATLEAQPGVRDAAVVLWPAQAGETTEPLLAAYLVPEPGSALELETLRLGLAWALPDYMRPSVYEELEALPLTAHRKVDRKALRRPRPATRSAAEDLPRGRLETRLAKLWSEVLGVAEVGREASFFALGGHSLGLTRLAARIRRELGVEVPLRRLFEGPTVAAQAAAVGEALAADGEAADGPAAGAPPPIRRLRDDRPARLSYAQQRLWFLHQLDPESAAFNLAFAFRLRGGLDVAALVAAFLELARRHRSLRTRLPAVDGEPRQIVDPAPRYTLPQVDLSGLSPAVADAEQHRVFEAVARRPFDLARGPLTRTVLVRRAADDHAVAVCLHHVISDGWSNGVLIRELGELYRARVAGRAPDLVAPSVAYTDFATWQRNWLKEEVLDAELTFWRRHLAGWPQRLELPSDRPRPVEASLRGATLSFVPRSLDLEALSGLAERNDTTLFVVLMAAFQVFLHTLTGKRRLLVGTDVANRRTRELEGVVGFFVNQLVLTGNLTGDPTFEALMGRVETAALAAYAHQDVPFDRVVDALGVERRLDLSPLFQVKLIVQNAPFEPLRLPGVELLPLELEKGTAQQDLVVALWQRDGRLQGWFNYSTDLFEEATVRRFMELLEATLTAVVEHPTARLEELRQRFVNYDRRLRTMSERRVKKPSLAAFKKSRPATVGTADELVKRSQPFDDALPLVLEPATAGVDLVAWVARERETVARDLQRHGAIFFRGFGLVEHEAFERFASSVCKSLFDENGEHPHESVTGNVYTPIFYSPGKKLLWHNENSFNFRWPSKIMFCSVRPADEGGETPVADSRRVYQAIDPEIRSRFEELGVRYQRNYGQGMGLDWREVFQTEDRSSVEAYCRENRFDFEWRDDGGLRTLCRRPAVVRHPETGEKTWFNQAQHWHPACLDEATRESLTHLYSEEDLPRHCTFGDGSPIPDEAMHHILEVYQQLEVALPWSRGDIMLVDNLLCAHARNPYRGERKLLVAMGDMASYGQLVA